MKVVFLSEVPAGYRTPLLTRLRVHLDLHVLYCAITDPWRGGALVELDDHEEVLEGFSFGGHHGGLRWKINPTVWRRLSSLRPDVVIIGGYALPTMQLAMLWCRMHHVPYVLHSESNSLTPRPLWRRVVKWIPASWAIRGASGFLPVSSAAAAYLRARGSGKKPMFILPNSPDVEAISLQVKDRPREGDRGPTFVFVGRLVPAKDPLTLVEAFRLVRAQVPEASLLIAGEGPLARELENLCSPEAVTRVNLLGFVSSAQLLALFEQADCLVLPSVYEPYGVVVLEAMAAGLPVILSDRVGSAQDVIEEGRNGFIFRAGDAVELAHRMIELTKSDIAAMGAVSRSVALDLNYDAGVEAVMSAITSAFASNGQK